MPTALEIATDAIRIARRNRAVLMQLFEGVQEGMDIEGAMRTARGRFKGHVTPADKAEADRLGVQANREKGVQDQREQERLAEKAEVK